MAYALNTLKWDRGLCFAFLAALAVISAVIRGKNVEEIVKSFSTGCAGMAFICFVMGAAAAIGTTLTKGNVLPTIINAVTVPLSQVSTGVSAALMFVMNAVINFLIPSRGGQAAVVIPIMAPIGDMLGITRGFSPKFLRRYANLADTINAAISKYIDDVKNVDFPNADEQY